LIKNPVAFQTRVSIGKITILTKNRYISAKIQDKKMNTDLL